MACTWETVAVDQDELLARLRVGQAADLDALAAVAPADPALAPLVLPGYPFAREHYWLPRPPAQAAAVAVLPQGSANPAVPAGPLGEAAVQDLILDCLASELQVARERLGKDAGFRAQGVDSMVGLRLIYRLAEATGVRLRHSDLAEFSTPTALAAAVCDRQGTPAPALVAEAVPLAGSPLSEGQQGLWRWQQMYPESAAYNLPLAFQVAGVDESVLARACCAVVAAWPLLGSRIELTEEGEPVWQPAAAPTVHEIALAAGETPEMAIAARSARPFDLASGVFRCEYLRGAPDTVLILAHHSVFDGLSAAHFSRYFWACYGCLAAGRDLPPVPAGAGFADFVAWEAAYLASPAAQADLAYWQGELAGELPWLDLPRERGAGTTPAPLGASQSRQLPGELVAACRACARDLAIDPSAFFLGLLHILLYRYTGQEDCLIGMPVLGRPEERFAGSIGYFANVLAQRAFPRGDLAAGEFLGAVQTRLTVSLDHGAWPFAALAGRLNTGHGADAPAGTLPLQVVFGWQSFLEPLDLSSAAGVPVTHLAEVRQVGDVPLAVECYAEGDQLRLVVAYDQDYFSADSIDRLIGHYCNLATAVCRDSASPIARLSMLDEAERQCLVEAWSGRGQPLPAVTENAGGAHCPPGRPLSRGNGPGGGGPVPQLWRAAGAGRPVGHLLGHLGRACRSAGGGPAWPGCRQHRGLARHAASGGHLGAPRRRLPGSAPGPDPG